MQQQTPLRAMDRRGFLAVLTGAAIAGPSRCVAARKTKRNRQPNIIFVIVDDMGYADLSCYGQRAYATKNLDRMAVEGIRFTQAYSGCTVCAPARSTLMTGLHMGHTPVRGNTGGIALPRNAVTVAQVLQQAGYTCGGFGKWGLGDLDTDGVPEKHGFAEFYGYYHQIHAHYYYPDYLIDTGTKDVLPGNRDFYEMYGKRRGGMPVKSSQKRHQFSAEMIFERMLRFIQAHRDEPFFCYAPWTPPHARYEMPEDDAAWQQVKGQPWPVQVKGHVAFNLIVDRQMGRLFELLRQLGIDQETIVFFCSDNGASERHEGTLNSCGPLRGFKRSMYEGGLRVPLIVRWPGHIQPGRTSDLPTYFPDVMPTLCELAGVSAHMPREIDGVSILPTLLGEADQHRHEFMYWEYPAYNWGRRQYTGKMGQAVRHEQWKLVRDDNTKPWELYDLSKNLGETTNLADQHPGIVRRMDAWVRMNRANPPEQIEPKKPEGKSYR